MFIIILKILVAILKRATAASSQNWLYIKVKTVILQKSVFVCSHITFSFDLYPKA